MPSMQASVLPHSPRGPWPCHPEHPPRGSQSRKGTTVSSRPPPFLLVLSRKQASQESCLLDKISWRDDGEGRVSWRTRRAGPQCGP